jgi:hypothetical protein
MGPARPHSGLGTNEPRASRAVRDGVTESAATVGRTTRGAATGTTSCECSHTHTRAGRTDDA